MAQFKLDRRILIAGLAIIVGLGLAIVASHMLRLEPVDSQTTEPSEPVALPMSAMDQAANHRAQGQYDLAAQAFERAAEQYEGEGDHDAWFFAMIDAQNSWSMQTQRDPGLIPLRERARLAAVVAAGIDPDAMPERWIISQNNLGIAHQDLGLRATVTDMAASTENLSLALAAYENVAHALTAKTAANDWANTKYKIGFVHQELARRTGQRENLVQAIAAYQDALQALDPETSPQAWAQTQNNLGNMHQTLGLADSDNSSDSDSSDTQNLTAAIQAYQSALSAMTPENDPIVWAQTQNNLGTALKTLAQQTQSASTFDQAIAAYNTALSVLSAQANAQTWGQTQHNLGVAYQQFGAMQGNVALLDNAITAYNRALDVRTRDATPVVWAQTKENLAIAYFEQAKQSGDTDSVQAGIMHVQQALEVYSGLEDAFYRNKASALLLDLQAMPAG